MCGALCARVSAGCDVVPPYVCVCVCVMCVRRGRVCHQHTLIHPLGTVFFCLVPDGNFFFLRCHGACSVRTSYVFTQHTMELCSPCPAPSRPTLIVEHIRAMFFCFFCVFGH